jgi:hypothetical protein
MAIDHPVGINVKVQVTWAIGVPTDITADVRFMELRSSSRSRLQQTWEPGSLRLVLDNSTRKYDPLYASGPYFGDIKPSKVVTVYFDCAATSQTPQFVGYTDKFTIDYDQSNRDSTVTITCIDPLGFCAFGAIPAGTTPPLVDGESAGTRRYTMLASAGIFDFVQDAGPGYTSSYAAEFSDYWDATQTHSLLDEMRRIGDLEQGPIISSLTASTPAVIFHGRHWFKFRTGSNTSQATIGTSGLPFQDIAVLFDADEIITSVAMSDERGNTAAVIDAAAVATYGPRYPYQTYDRLPARNDEQLEGAANTVMGLRATEEFRVEQLTIKPGSDTDWQEKIVLLDPLDRVTVDYTPTGTGSAISADYFIDGITHQVSPGDWTTTYSLMPANRFDDALPDDLFVIGSSLVDGTDLVGF